MELNVEIVHPLLLDVCGSPVRFTVKRGRRGALFRSALVDDIKVRPR